jgi:2-hydroxymuconate-semialdehyde hydrolase
VLDELGVQRATVVGHDIGGGVAQILAVWHPERVARLGLVDSVCYDSWPIPEMRAARKTAGVVELNRAGIAGGSNS